MSARYRTNIYQVKWATKNARHRINISERCEKTWLLLTLLFAYILLSATQTAKQFTWLFFFYVAVWPIIGSYFMYPVFLYVCLCVLSQTAPVANSSIIVW